MRVLLFVIAALLACASLVSAQTFTAQFSQISGQVLRNQVTFPIGVTQVARMTTWTNRNNLGTAAYDQNVWVIGGFEGTVDPTTGSPNQRLLNDVHLSQDGGVSWRVMNYNAVWKPRNALQAVAYQTTNPNTGLTVVAVLFTGGQIDGSVISDTWISYDLGSTWTLQCFRFEQVTSPFGDNRAVSVSNCGWKGRYGHTLTATTNGVLLLAGGADNVPNYLNDVWRSTNNGVSWTEINGVATTSITDIPNQITPTIFRPRSNHAACLTTPINNNPLSSFFLILGGRNPNQFNDVWRSVDALTVQSGNLASWSLLTAAPGWAPRFGHGVSVLACLNAIYVIGGDVFNQAARSDPTIRTSQNDVWASTDNGQTWSLVTNVAGFNPRELFGLVQTFSTIVLLGGVVAAGNGNTITFSQTTTPFFDDVWSTAFGSFIVGAYGTCQCNPNLAGYGTQTRSVTCPTAEACCTGVRPPTTQACPCFGYLQSGFGACSVTCGSGIQTQTVSCVNLVNGTNFGTPGTGLTPCDSITASIGVAPASTRACNLQACPICQYVTTSFGACSATCGGGVQTRPSASCVDQFGAPQPSTCCQNAGLVLPATSQVCNTNVCPICQYATSTFGACSTTCGGGIQTRAAATCIDQFGSAQPTSCCQNAGLVVPPTSQVCNTNVCPICQYVTPSFGACSTTCGGGIQTRAPATCVDQFGVNQGTQCCNAAGLVVPPTSQVCNTNVCPICQYVVSPFPACPQTCGGGLQTRAPAVCLDQFGVNQGTQCCTAAGLVAPTTQQVCNTNPCPTHVLGDPEFVGFNGQKFEIHGVPDQVFNIITSPLMQYNALFVYIGHKSNYYCNKTRTHPWTHPGTYLGTLGIQTVGGDKIEIHSGSCQHGIKSLTLNGHKMKVGERKMLTQVSEAGITQQIYYKDQFQVEVRLAEVTLILTNSDHFFNQEVSLTSYGEEKLATHGLLGQTWNDKTYVVDGVRRVIQGVPTDYLVQEEDIFGADFVYNKFNVAKDE